MKNTAFQQLTQLPHYNKKIISAISKQDMVELTSLVQSYPGTMKESFLLKALSAAVKNQYLGAIGLFLPLASRPIKFEAAFENLIFNTPNTLSLLQFSEKDKIAFFNQQDDFEQTQLHKIFDMADKSICEELVRDIVNSAIAPQIKFVLTSTQESLLHASIYKNVENISLLYPYFPKKHFISLEENTGYAPIHYLFKSSPALFEATVDQMSTLNIDIHYSNKFKNNLFIHLARNDCTDLIEILLNKVGTQKLYEKTDSKHLALHASIAEGHEKTSLFLIENGFDIWSKNAMELDPLWLACRFYSKNNQVFNALISKITPDKVQDLNALIEANDNKDKPEEKNKSKENIADLTGFKNAELFILSSEDGKGSKHRDYISVLAEYAPLEAIQKLLFLGIKESSLAHKTMTSALRSNISNEKEKKINFLLNKNQNEVVLSSSYENLTKGPSQFSYKPRMNDFFLTQLIIHTAPSKVIDEIEKYQEKHSIKFSSVDWALALCSAINHTNVDLFNYIIKQQDLNTLKSNIIETQKTYSEEINHSYDKSIKYLIKFKNEKKVTSFLEAIEPQGQEIILDILNTGSKEHYNNTPILKQLFLHKPDLFLNLFKEEKPNNSTYLSVILGISRIITVEEAPLFLKQISHLPQETQIEFIEGADSTSAIFQIDFTAYLSQSWITKTEITKFFKQHYQLENRKNIELDKEIQNKNFNFLIDKAAVAPTPLKDFMLAFLYTEDNARSGVLYNLLIAKKIKLAQIDMKELHVFHHVPSSWKISKLTQFYDLFSHTKGATPEVLGTYILNNCEEAVSSGSALKSDKNTALSIENHLSFLPPDSLTGETEDRLLKIYQKAVSRLNLDSAHMLYSKYKDNIPDFEQMRYSSFATLELDNLSKKNIPKILKQLNTHFGLSKEFFVQSIISSMEKEKNTYTLLRAYEAASSSETIHKEIEEAILNPKSPILNHCFSDTSSNKTVLEFHNKPGKKQFMGQDDKIKIKLFNIILARLHKDEVWAAELLKQNFKPDIQSFLEQALFNKYTENTTSKRAKMKI